MEDLAKAAGVSKGTVTRAFSTRKVRIHSETKARILRIAEKMGYHPSISHYRMRARESKIVAKPIVVGTSDFPNSFSELDVMYTSLQILSREGYQFVPLFFPSYTEMAERLPGMYRACHFDGLMLGTPDIEKLPDPNVIFTLANQGCAIAIHGMHVEKFLHPNIRRVSVDGSEVVYEGIRHLMRQGRRRIFVAYPKRLSLTRLCEGEHRPLKKMLQSGRVRLFSDADVGGCPNYFFHRELYEDLAIAVVREIPKIDGACLRDDWTAWYFQKGLWRCGKKIPEDVSVAAGADERVRYYPTPIVVLLRSSFAFTARHMAEGILEILRLQHTSEKWEPLPSKVGCQPVRTVVEASAKEYLQISNYERRLEAALQADSGNHENHEKNR